MSAKKSSARKPLAGASKRSSSSGDSQTQAAQRKLEEVQLATLSARLKELSNNREIVRALGGDPERYASQLAKQYADLSRKRRPTRLVARSLPANLTAILDRFGDIFNWWQYVVAPNATVGLDQPPATTDASGSIGADIFQGELALGGEISNGDMQEQWWVNTWQYIVPFPATPSSSPSSASLSYRFDVSAILDFYRQDLVTGSVHVYATVATTNDLANRLIDFNNPVSSDFAIVATLPASGVPPQVSGVTHVTGTIPLVPGATPAIGILIGLIISVASGDLLVLPGDSFINLIPPGATVPSDLGKIQYRSDPPFWVNAVAKMFTE